ncbi:MAG: replication initiator protein A [Lachnospiraceae bacterium]|nr:replication initiator protein A [Lachnospiraceae bacterium]
MEFDYFYEEQSESYSFYRIPKLLFTEGMFEALSTEAKVLYGLLLDRISLSREHGWIDASGRVYVYYTITTVKKALGCGNSKACRLLKELDTFGLTERKRQGHCKPTIIYVKDFTRFPKLEIRTSQNGNSCDLKPGTHDISEQESIKTYKNNTEINNTDPILSATDVDKDMDERESYRDYLFDALEMEALNERYPYDRDTLEAILDLMVDVICSKRKYIRIAGDDKPLNVVKSQFMKVDASHIEYVMDCMKNNGTKVRNIKQYLLAAIYNAPFTIQSFYQAMVNNDMAEGRLYGG